MDLEIKVTYDIIAEKVCIIKKNLLSSLQEYVAEDLKDFRNVKEEDIDDAIRDYLYENCRVHNQFIPKEDMDKYPDIIQVELLNQDVIKKELQYLIRDSGENCCTDAPQDANYCPTCGKKLK